MSTSHPPGSLLRQWRTRRRLSQLQLASRAAVSTRHLSCVETGRSRPSRELLIHLAAELDMPGRDTNELLLAAGFAPTFSQFALDDGPMEPVRQVIDLVLERSDPNPTLVIDTRWNIVDANPGALWLTSGIAPELLQPPLNVARLSLHPRGLAPRIVNLGDYADHLLNQMHRTFSMTHDPELGALLEELGNYDLPPLDERWPSTPTLVLPLHLRIYRDDLVFISTITTFGAARDITASELSIETLYPADESSAAVLERRPWLTAPASSAPRTM